MDTTLTIGIAGLIVAVASLVLFLYLAWTYREGFTGIVKLSEIIDSRLKDDSDAEMMHDAIDSFYHLGAAAQNVNAILTDEEAFDGLLTELASRVRKSIMASVMGTASGDVKKKARAERILNDALVDGAQQMNPMLGMLLKVTGLDEELKADPELLGFILQIVQEKGLLNMFDQSMLSLPSNEQQARVKQQLGIDF